MQEQAKWMDQSPDTMARGFVESEEGFECLLCGKHTVKGMVYPEGTLFADARRSMSSHVEQAHGSVFDWLLQQDRKETGLTEQQTRLLRLFMDGVSDVEIMRTLGLGNASTVRNHRAQMRERERHARVWIALMTLLRAGKGQTKEHVVPHDGAAAVDDRWIITVEEEQDMLRKYFPDGPDGRISTFGMKEKGKIVVLRQLTRRFRPGRIYAEKEVNAILKTAFDDFATLRRYFIEYGFMERNPDGSRYWLKGTPPVEEAREETEMDASRKKELLSQFKELKREGGAYCIRNRENGKVLVQATSNFRTMNGRRFDLNNGTHPVPELQADWNAFGADAFDFEILERLEENEESPTARKWALEELERKWIEQLQPFDDKGYNRRKST